MSTLLIEGGHPLSGRIDVAGNKNAALPLLAACLLTDQPCVLSNAPRIRDVDAMVRLLVGLGAEVEGAGTSAVRVQCVTVSSDEPDRSLVGSLRGSVLLLGPLLARRGRARLVPPGGDFPARRTITAHLQALLRDGRAGGARADLHPRCAGGLAGRFHLSRGGVGDRHRDRRAGGGGRVRPQRDPSRRVRAPRRGVVPIPAADGCRHSWRGDPKITVTGADRLGGATQRLHGDYVEAGSWAVVAAVTRGDIEIHGARDVDLEPAVAVLERMGVRCALDPGRLRVEASSPVGTRRITTGPWPGFPSDMVSLVTVLATQAEGRTLIHDWMYELRLFALEQLSGMNADLFLCDPHRIIVTGPRQLRGRNLDTRDLRSGMALIGAALAADGISRVRPLETVERGYADIVPRLRALGARVSVEDP